MFPIYVFLFFFPSVVSRRVLFFQLELFEPFFFFFAFFFFLFFHLVLFSFSFFFFFSWVVFYCASALRPCSNPTRSGHLSFFPPPVVSSPISYGSPSSYLILPCSRPLFFPYVSFRVRTIFFFFLLSEPPCCQGFFFFFGCY